MRAKKNNALLVLAAASLAAGVGLALWLTQPGASPATGTQVARRPSEPEAVHDRSAYAPGSPAAVAEAFLRLWWRGHYDDARALTTGAVRARCERNLQKTLTLSPDEREQLRQVQVLAEAVQYDLERARVSDLDPGDAGAARKRVEGEVHAHGPSPDGRRVESRRGQTLVVEMVDGAWRVAEWTPAATDAGIVVH